MDDGLHALYRMVRESAPPPADRHGLAAQLESMGVTDAIAKGTYGFGNVFELAEALYNGYPWKTPGTPTKMSGSIDDGHLTPFRAITGFIRHFLRGTMFFMPMLVSILAVLGKGLSLWAYVGFDAATATAIAMGTILSFLITGGLTQVMGRRGLMYLSQNEYGMARRFVFLVFRIGLVSALTVGVATVALNLLLGLVPWGFMSVMLGYYGFLSLIWVCIAALYMLQQEVLFTLLVIMGIGLVYMLHLLLGWPVMAAQMVGLAFSSLGSLGTAIWNLYTKEKRQGRTYGAAPFPRRSVLLYTLLPYYAYGFLYFAMLFTDRIMAWSIDPLMGFPIWFRGQYELGMDWASFALVIPMGMVEWYTGRFFPTLATMEKGMALSEMERFQRAQLRSYVRKLLGFMVMTITSGILVWLAFNHLSGRMLWPGMDTPLSMDHTTRFVAMWAIPGYALLSLGLLNSLMLFTMSMPKPVLGAVAAGLLVDATVGFVLSRAFGHEFAVMGLVAGAGVFAAMGTVSAVRMFRGIAFNHYGTM